MAWILRGKRKGEKVKIRQWCNDWFSCETDEGPKIFSPTSLQFAPKEMLKILEHDNNGFLLSVYEPTLDGRFKRRKNK